MTKYRLISISIIILGVSLGLVMNNTGGDGDAAQSAASKTGGISTTYSVSVVTASKQSVANEFTLTGTIAANNDVTIISETQGRVVKVLAQVGEFKQAGSVLVEVDAELKEANYKTATMTYEKAKKDLERFESLFKENSISESQIEQARWSFQNAEAQYIIAKRQLKDTKITTPISGIITARYVDIGSMVMGAPQSTVIANVVDISKLKVKINVAEKDVFKMKVGDNVKVTTDIYPDAVFNGKIATISSKGDEAHTYPVEVRIENSTKFPLKAGMFGRAQFTLKSGTDHIIVPREAVIGSLKDAKVYVVKNGTANLRSIKTGREIGTNVEIVSGVNEGESVIVNGQNNLKDNAAVIVRNK